jgi:cytochrome c biogenesis protein CcmG/thiol:disulfide interchange protein DsbE
VPPSSRRARLLLAAIALGIVVVVGGITWIALRDDDTTAGSGRAPIASPNVVRAGEVAPDFELSTLDGGTIRLSDLRGTPVVLNFWASWCTPCRNEFPLLSALDEDANGRYTILGVDSQDLRSDAQAFARQRGAEWTNGFDPDGAVAQSYGARGLPYTFFIEADGKISSVLSTELSDDLLHEQVAKLLRGS